LEFFNEKPGQFVLNKICHTNLSIGFSVGLFVVSGLWILRDTELREWGRVTHGENNKWE